MKNLKLVLFGSILFSVFSWWACNKEVLHSDGKKVNVVFKGKILTEDGYPISGAQVRINSLYLSTGENGEFQTEKIQVWNNNAIIEVSQQGCFQFSRAHFVEDNSVQNITIRLLTRNVVGTFDNDAGGTIQIPGGASLEFPAGATTIAGKIRVFARYLNPQEENLGYFMPGDLRGITADGEEAMLATYGMLAVELESLAGNTAEIATGKEVELTMPVNTASAPPEIPLWYYNVEKARWIEEGMARKEGNRYVGKVKHFSFWNCDIDLPLVELSGKIYLDNESHPLEHVLITMTDLETQSSSYAYTDNNGCFSGGVLKDARMKMTIHAWTPCGEEAVYTETIGPFSEITSLPPIIVGLSNTSFFKISGDLVDCSGQPIANGYVYVTGHDSIFVDQNGHFEYEAVSCNQSISVEFQAFDPYHLKTGPIQSITFQTGDENVNLGAIVVCTEAEQYLKYDLDGQIFSSIGPYGGISVPPQGGDPIVYIYNYAEGSPSINFNFQASQPGNYPVSGIYSSLIDIPESQYSQIQINLITFPAVLNDFFTGFFIGNFQDQQGNPHTLSGNFKVRRNN